MQQQQPQVSPWPIPYKVPTTNQQATSGRKPPQLRKLLNSTNNTTSLVETVYMPETSRGTLSKTIMKSTTLLKRTWEQLLSR
jgi:hypothetical protein